MHSQTMISIVILGTCAFQLLLSNGLHFAYRLVNIFHLISESEFMQIVCNCRSQIKKCFSSFWVIGCPMNWKWYSLVVSIVYFQRFFLLPFDVYIIFRRKVVLSDTVGFISDLPVQVLEAWAVTFLFYNLFFKIFLAKTKNFFCSWSKHFMQL